jgi:hypothetical protein
MVPGLSGGRTKIYPLGAPPHCSAIGVFEINSQEAFPNIRRDFVEKGFFIVEHESFDLGVWASRFLASTARGH